MCRPMRSARALFGPWWLDPQRLAAWAHRGLRTLRCALGATLWHTRRCPWRHPLRGSAHATRGWLPWDSRTTRAAHHALLRLWRHHQRHASVVADHRPFDHVAALHDRRIRPGIELQRSHRDQRETDVRGVSPGIRLRRHHLQREVHPLRIPLLPVGAGLLVQVVLALRLIGEPLALGVLDLVGNILAYDPTGKPARMLRQQQRTLLALALPGIRHGLIRRGRPQRQDISGLQLVGGIGWRTLTRVATIGRRLVLVVRRRSRRRECAQRGAHGARHPPATRLSYI